uniref:Cell adhesion molecule 3 n=2 Tax=Bos TaxID=9903 RepID=A0AAA9T1V6_BOVIN
MGAPSALPLLLLFACCWAPGGANLSQDDSQPWTSDETVVAGGTVVLKCQVKDHEDSSLQWSNPAQQTLYFGEKRALRDNRIQLVKSTPHELSISISNVALADEGEYTCSIFTMPVRTAKSLVTVLGIPQKPIISGYKSSLREKDKTTLSCQSSGSKPAAQLTWRKGDQELHGESTRIQEDPNGKTFTVSSSVTFQVTREDDGADIVCSVNHESLKGADRSTAQRIEVLYTPTAKIRPDPPHPREGQKLLLHCEGRGNPVPQQYVWEKEGSVPPLKMAQESALIFPFLNKSDSGTYGCTATSNMGSYKAYYTLNVNASPDRGWEWTRRATVHHWRARGLRLRVHSWMWNKEKSMGCWTLICLCLAAMTPVIPSFNLCTHLATRIRIVCPAPRVTHVCV